MVLLAIALTLFSIILTMIINKNVKCDNRDHSKKQIDKVSPIIGLSAILIGTTIMVGYILVSYLGKLGTFLAETLKTWIS